MGEVIPAAILLGASAVLAIGQPPLLRIDRTGAAVIGAILMTTVGGLPLDEAFRAVDYRTLILLSGMMVLIANRRLSRFSTSLARVILSAIHHPAALLVAVVFASGALSACFVNDTVCLVFTPVRLVTCRVTPNRFYRQIDWGLLTLFVGLFIVIAGIERVGPDRACFAVLRPIGIETMRRLCLAAVALSDLTSHVPAVMRFSGVVPHLPDPRTSRLALAMSGTLAGNLTILGSIANAIVVEGARRRGVVVSFRPHLRVGLPVTLATTTFGTWWPSLGTVS